MTRLLPALAIFAGWILITVFADRIWHMPHAHLPLAEGVSGRVQFSYVLAIGFLLFCVAALRLKDVGLVKPAATWRFVWFPALYVLGFAALMLVVGAPPPITVLIIAANTLMVGFSEELACRGVLFQGIRASIAIWPAILLSSFLFGAVHLFNGISTGDFPSAAVQSVTAFMTGIAFLAIRIRTGSLLPGILLHAAWDFALVTAAAGAATGEVAISTDTEWRLFVPVVLVLPNFLFGLFLLRNIGRNRAER